MMNSPLPTSAAAKLPPPLASHMADIVLAGIQREFPNKLDHVINTPDEVQSPRALHPAFYGCFDWHSAVHGHWLLARILRLHPDLPQASAIRAIFDAHFTPATIAAECSYLLRPSTGAFERTYGWAWLLKLTQELLLLGSHAASLAPLAAAFTDRYLRYLPRLTYPIRSGTHPNTAFGLAFAHDYALHIGHHELRELVEARARDFYLHDADYPAHLEPGGADFFSPALLEADLMRRILGNDFPAWFARFLPRPAFTPAIVSDRSDLQIVHLDGLNLSRAWCLRNLAAALPPHPSSTHLSSLASQHLDAALPHIASGHYAGEHWLATFALLALTGD